MLLRRSLLSLTLVMAAAAARAQIGFTGLYAEDFNALPLSGTPAWTDNVTLPGWYSNRATVRTGTGSSATGGLYSFGASGSAERALGSLASSGTGAILFGVQLRNDTAAPITQLDISYHGEQWRSSNTAAQALSADFLAAGSADNALTGGSFTAFSPLNFLSPNVANAGAIDGNAAENRTAVHGTLTGLSWNPGEYLWLRWGDADDTGSDHGLAVDDLRVSASAPPTASEPGAGALAAAGAGVLALTRRRRALAARAIRVRP